MAALLRVSEVMREISVPRSLHGEDHRMHKRRIVIASCVTWCALLAAFLVLRALRAPEESASVLEMLCIWSVIAAPPLLFVLSALMRPDA